MQHIYFPCTCRYSLQHPQRPDCIYSFQDDKVLQLDHPWHGADSFVTDVVRGEGVLLFENALRFSKVNVGGSELLEGRFCRRGHARIEVTQAEIDCILAKYATLADQDGSVYVHAPQRRFDKRPLPLNLAAAEVVCQGLGKAVSSLGARKASNAACKSKKGKKLCNGKKRRTPCNRNAVQSGCKTGRKPCNGKPSSSIRKPTAASQQQKRQQLRMAREVMGLSTPRKPHTLGVTYEDVVYTASAPRRSNRLVPESN